MIQPRPPRFKPSLRCSPIRSAGTRRPPGCRCLRSPHGGLPRPGARAASRFSACFAAFSTGALRDATVIRCTQASKASGSRSFPREHRTSTATSWATSAASSRLGIKMRCAGTGEAHGGPAARPRRHRRCESAPLGRRRVRGFLLAQCPSRALVAGKLKNLAGPLNCSARRSGRRASRRSALIRNSGSLPVRPR